MFGMSPAAPTSCRNFLKRSTNALLHPQPVVPLKCVEVGRLQPDHKVSLPRFLAIWSMFSNYNTTSIMFFDDNVCAWPWISSLHSKLRARHLKISRLDTEELLPFMLTLASRLEKEQNLEGSPSRAPSSRRQRK